MKIAAKWDDDKVMNENGRRKQILVLPKSLIKASTIFELNIENGDGWSRSWTIKFIEEDQ